MAKSGERLGEFLVDRDVITKQQLQAALERQSSSQARLGEILVDEGLLTERELVEFLGEQTGYPVVSLDQYPRDEEALNHLDESDARQYQVVPLLIDGGDLILAMKDPLDLVAQDDLEQLVDPEIEPVIAPRDQIDEYLDRWYGNQESGKDLPEIRLRRPDGEAGPVVDGGDVEKDRGVAVGLVNRLIEDAIAQGASNVHISPRGDHVNVAFRIDGAVHPQTELPSRLHQPIMSRLKVLADQYREPQVEEPSYRLIRLTFGEEQVTLRLNTINTRFGEKLNLKVCRGSNYDRHLTDLGMDVDALEILERLLSTPRGLIIYTGPSDSGKTTSLYASLRYLSDTPSNIMTVEHPIEFDLDFCTQIEAANPDPEVHANKVYESLKVDPDVLMVTDMGEPEVARATLYASATGRQVLSTYFADNTVDALYHLANTTGVDRYQLANSTVGVVSQRLVRLFKDSHREEYQPPAEKLERLGLPKDRTYYRPRDTDGSETPYKGVTGIFQVLPMTDELRMCILEQKPYEDYMEAARALGLPSLREKGMQKVLSGATSIDEVCRVTFREDLTRGLSIDQ